MEIQTLGPQALLICAAEPELRRRGLDPDAPEAEEILHLAREALLLRGVSPRRLMEISALSTPNALLLLLRLSTPEEEWFPFPDLPLALDALAALPTAPEGALVWHKARYLLGTRSPDHGCLLSEFAAPLSQRAARTLEEQATLILDEAALARLWTLLNR